MYSLFHKVENNVLAERPKSAKQVRNGIINFPAPATDDDYRAHGFWPIVGNAPAYDAATQHLSGPTYVIDTVAETVTRSWTVTDIPIEDLRAAKIQALTEKVKAVLDAHMADYSEWEAVIWPDLKREAEQYQADDTVGPYMTAEIGGKYATADELAAVVLQRSDAMKDLRAAVILNRQAHEAAINDPDATAADIAGHDIGAGWPA